MKNSPKNPLLPTPIQIEIFEDYQKKERLNSSFPKFRWMNEINQEKDSYAWSRIKPSACHKFANSELNNIRNFNTKKENFLEKKISSSSVD